MATTVGTVPRVRIQAADFSLDEEVARLRQGDEGVGAVVAFVGCVRDIGSVRTVTAMELEHYPGMTERSIEAMIDMAFERFDLRGALVIHRVGRLLPQDQIVLVATSSAHRGQAFLGCEFLMDYLKSEAPFWKKEDTPSGSAWVDARSSDDAALARWGVNTANAEALDTGTGNPGTVATATTGAEADGPGLSSDLPRAPA